MFWISFLFLFQWLSFSGLPAPEQKILGNQFVLANMFWDEDRNFVINETDEYYNKSYQEFPFVLGDVFGKTWTIKKEKIKPIYQLPEVNYFGTFTAFHQQQPLYMVRTNHYYLGHQDEKPQFGMRFLPYSDTSTKELDEYIRFRHGLGPEDVFVAPTYYFHQEYYKGDITELDRLSRFDDGFTHMGAYIGEGKTRNSPYDYHDMKLQTQGYPANLTRVVYKGVTQQAEFQKNFYLTLKLLNELNGGVKFSRLDYQQDYYDANNLKAIFDFYRAWLDPSWIRKKEDGRPFYELILEDVKYDIYCSEHIAMVLNIAVNLVQTKAGYIRVFGTDAEQPKRGEAEQTGGILKGGEYFWNLAQQRWKDEIGEDWKSVDDSSYTEMWRLYQGTQPIQVTKVTEVGRYLAWPPQTLTDLIANMMTLYTRFDRVGKEMTLQTLQGVKAIIAARVQFKEKWKDVGVNTVHDFPQEKLDALIQPFVDLVHKYWGKAESKGANQAYKGFQEEAQALIFKYRDPSFLKLEEDSFFYYATPHVLHRIVQGLHPYSKYIEFEIIGTALPASDLDLHKP